MLTPFSLLYMFRYNHRTLLIALALGPPILALTGFVASDVVKHWAQNHEQNRLIIITPVCARASAGLPYQPPLSPPPVEDKPE